MNRAIITVLTMFLAAGCSDGGTPGGGAGNAAKQGDAAAHTVKPQGPVQISFNIIGTPIVGQPIAIDLQVQSTLGPQAVSLSYRITDSTAMQFPEAQPARVTLAPSSGEAPSFQQVRVIPLREGRLFLNVSAEIETEDGAFSTVTAIPIQVGGAPPRQVRQHGAETTDEDGEAIKVLQGE